MEKAQKLIQCETCKAVDERALHRTGSSLILSTENRSCSDNTMSTSRLRELWRARNVTHTRAHGWITAGSSPAHSCRARAGSGTALGLHGSTHVRVFRPGKNNPADAQCFQIVCWHHMRCLSSLYSSESGVRQAKLHEIQCLGCLQVQYERQGQKNSYNKQDE